MFISIEKTANVKMDLEVFIITYNMTENLRTTLSYLVNSVLNMFSYNRTG